ncbi:MAG: acetyl esterase [Verrucomicrobiales bacterium]|jgi:acetyl esterase
MRKPSTKLPIHDRQRELLAGATEHRYKDLGGGEGLQLHVYAPQTGAEQPCPAIVFFYGGGFWERGELSQFAPQCLQLAERGMVAILADYRLGKNRGVSPLDGVEDALDAVGWIAANAERLGIDAGKIVVGGASSGAHVTLAATMPEDGIEPAALVLFSPIVNAVRESVIDLFGDKKTAKSVSPLHLIRKGLPPMIIFHGAEDRVQPVGDVETFARKVLRKKNHCEMNLFMGERSSYFNFNVNAEMYESTLNAVDDFLVRQGILASGAGGGATTRLDSR